MLGLGLRRTHRPPLELVCSTLFSCLVVVLTQFALLMIPRYLQSLSFLAMLPLSVLVCGAMIAVGRCLRWLFGVSALAPALVLFNILFLWGVYVAVVRRAVPSLLDDIFNGVCTLLLFGHYRGLCRSLSGDPELVGCESSCLKTLEQNDFEAQLQYEELLALLDAHCREENRKIPAGANAIFSEFNFLYLPIDFVTENNLGYAFVNFTNSTGADRLYRFLHHRNWAAYSSRKKL